MKHMEGRERQAYGTMKQSQTLQASHENVLLRSHCYKLAYLIFTGYSTLTSIITWLMLTLTNLISSQAGMQLSIGSYAMLSDVKPQ